MPPLSVVTPKEVINAFKKFRWQVMRQKGSHIILTKPGNISSLSIPNLKEIARGTLRSLISKAGLTNEEFVKEL